MRNKQLTEARIKRASVVLEQKYVLLEATTEQQLQNTSHALEKLRYVLGNTSQKLPGLADALEQAQANLATSIESMTASNMTWKSLKDQMRTKAWAKIATNISDAVAISTTVIGGFKKLPTIVSALMRADASINRDQPLNKLQGINGQSLAKLFVRSFAMPGALQKIIRFLGGSAIPYINDKRLAAELMNLSINEIAGIAKRAADLDSPIPVQQPQQQASQAQPAEKQPEQPAASGAPAVPAPEQKPAAAPTPEKTPAKSGGKKGKEGKKDLRATVQDALKDHIPEDKLAATSQAVIDAIVAQMR